MQAAINSAGYGHLINIKAEKASNKAIESELKADAKREARTIRILVLGTGDSGKSTFIKNMMIAHLEKNPFLPSQITGFKNALRLNVVESLVVLCKTFLKSKANAEHALAGDAKKFGALKQVPESLTADLAKQIAKFWANQIIKDVYTNRGDIQIHSSTPYYLDNCERFADGNYTPIPLDILHCRERTSGVHETSIEIEGLLIRFIDVGGQKAERRKWIDHFSGCTLVIYVTALDSYTRVLEEDGKTNRLKDSIACLKDISANKHLKKIPFQIFLNKLDIYEEIFDKNKMSDFFPECKATTKAEGIKWIGEQYAKEFKGEKMMTPLPTNVLDTKNIGKIWGSVREVVVGQQVRQNTDEMV